jgi:hypothetical protein
MFQKLLQLQVYLYNYSNIYPNAGGHTEIGGDKQEYGIYVRVRVPVVT